MPSRNTIKQYQEGGYYHIYNRGVEKRDIFMDDQDYRVFLGYLKLYLDPDQKKRPDNLPELSKEIDLLAYCLMPNHFHLLVRQNTAEGITKLMKSIGTKYAMYFNTRHNRVGSLFQGTYKAVLAESDEQIMHLTRYIHLNPQTIRLSYLRYPYSSYRYFVLGHAPRWLKHIDVLSLFSGSMEFSDFHEGLIRDSKPLLGNLVID